MKSASGRQINHGSPPRRKAVATLSPAPKTRSAKKPWSDLRQRLATQPARPTLDLARLFSEDRGDPR